jgi:hypothetical protein
LNLVEKDTSVGVRGNIYPSKMNSPSASMLHHFAAVTDPRVDLQKKSTSEYCFVVALCGVICGADNWVEIEEYGRANPVDAVNNVHRICACEGA